MNCFTVSKENKNFYNVEECRHMSKTKRNNDESHFNLVGKMKILGAFLSLAFVECLWASINMNIYFRSLILGMTVVMLVISGCDMFKEKSWIFLTLYSIVCFFIASVCFNWWHVNLKLKKLNLDLRFNLSNWAWIAFALFFALLLWVIAGISDNVYYPTSDYYVKLKDMTKRELFNKKLVFERQKSLFEEIEKVVAGLYALLVGGIITFGTGLLNKGLSDKITSDLQRAFFETSGSVLSLAFVIFILILLLQFFAFHFKNVAEQRLNMINQFITDDKTKVTKI